MGIPVYPETISPKSRLAATLLAYFVGWLGVHRFYIGKVGTGAIILALYIIGAILYGVGMIFSVMSTAGAMYSTNISEWAGSLTVFVIGGIMMGAAGIWGFVDFIFIVIGRGKDKQGRLIKRWDT